MAYKKHLKRIHLYIRLRHGMFCHEDGTTIFIRQNGSLVSADLLGYFYDELVKTALETKELIIAEA